MSTHEQNDACDGHEIPEIKISRLNAGIAMLKLVEYDPENRKVRFEIRRGIAEAESDVIELGGELWIPHDQRPEVVRRFETENRYRRKNQDCRKPGVRAYMK